MKKALWLNLPRYGGPRLPDSPEAELLRYRRRTIATRTPDRAREERQYRQEVSEWLRLPENKWCQVYLRVLKQNIPATECHHYQGRRGMLLLYKPFWIPVSHAGHVWIDNNRQKARELGLLCPLGKYNSPVKV